MRKKIFIPFILIFSLFLSLLTPSVSNVLAQEQGDVITEMTVTDAEGKPITGDISQWQTFRINGKFSLPDNTVKAGDTTTVTLPPEIQFSGQATFELRDEQKELVGTGVVNNNNPREIIITYTKYPETKSGVKGSFYFYVKFDFNVVPTRKEVPIDIKVSGKIMHAGNVTYEGIGQIDKSDIAKSGWQDKDDPKIGHFYIDINRGNKDMSDIKLVDVLKDPNVTYIPDSFRIYRGTLDFRNGDWGMYDEELITDEVLPDRDAVANSNTFTLHFGNLLKDKGIRIFYDVKLGHTPVDSEKFLNDATLTTAEGIEELVHSGYTFYAAGGKAEGYVYKIKIKKVNEQREALEGATFDVIRERTGRSVGTITTDAKGEGTLGDLLNDTYILRETEAPRGYVKAEDVKINPSDFDADTKLATKQIINKQETISIPVTKIWEGDQPTMRPETITVQLLADGEEVSGKTLKLDATSDWKGTFTDLPKMKDGKEIVYTIKEVVVPKGYTSEISGDATTGYTVTNTYRTTPTTATIVAKKTLENRDLLADEFSFKLAKEDGEVIKTVTNDGAGNIKFPELSFDKAGIYNYTITEVKGTDSTITYDETPVKVTVTVKDNGKGQLEAQVSYEDGDKTFTNTYTPTAPASIVLKAHKSLEGKDLVANQFSFTLTDKETNKVYSAQNAADGSVSFEELTFDKEGKFEFELAEVKGNLPGIVYDETKVAVTIEVTKEGNELKAQVITPNEPDENAAVYTFKNKYQAKSTTAQLSVTKVLTGRELKADEFSFTLINADGEELETVKNTATGVVAFSTLTYVTPGEFTYTIKENKGEVAGVTYDEKTIEATVKVVDDGQGQLKVEQITYKNDDKTFKNTYTTAPAKATIQVAKSLTGRELKADEFSFTLTDESGKEIETVTNDGDGNVVFGELTFDKAGTYTYKVKEVKGTDSEITYDTKELAITVTVTDNGQGQLVAVVDYPAEKQFVNEYVTTTTTASTTPSTTESTTTTTESTTPSTTESTTTTTESTTASTTESTTTTTESTTPSTTESTTTTTESTTASTTESTMTTTASTTPSTTESTTTTTESTTPSTTESTTTTTESTTPSMTESTTTTTASTTPSTTESTTTTTESTTPSTTESTTTTTEGTTMTTVSTSGGVTTTNVTPKGGSSRRRVTLPSTGEANGGLFIVLGTVVLAAVGYGLKRHRR